MSVQAKFYCATLSVNAYNPDAKVVHLQPVTRGKENQAWASATPIGAIDMTIQNKEAADQFEIGGEYIITFERAYPA